MARVRGRVVLLALAAALVAGCGGGDKAATQVAAKVNGDEITVHQINYFLSRSGLPPEGMEAAKRQMLERLIDQQIAKQQAIERKLDRTPAALHSIEAARDEILARTYREQVATGVPAPTEDEVRAFYAEHPELFAQRKLFGLEEISVALPQPAAKEFKAFVARGTDLREAAGWLKSQNAPFADQRGIRAAEELPLDWLTQMQQMKSGDTRLFENGERLYLVRVAATQAAPIEEAAARPRIRQYLINRRVREAIASDAEHLRGKSNIEYTGEFAGTAPARTARPPEPFQPVQPDSIDKGVRGLR